MSLDEVLPNPAAAAPASPVGKQREFMLFVTSQAALGLKTPGG